MLLDEATSALDACTEAMIQEDLDRLRCTRILIAHRLSAVKNADRIIVMQAGRVTEQGNFTELMQTGTVFPQLVRGQVTTRSAMQAS